jgi:hypothetical protein
MKMNKPYINHTFVIILFVFGQSLFAQSNFNLKLTTISYQFTDVQPELAKLKLSENGQFAFEPGLIIGFEGYATNNAALKISQSFLCDKAAHLAGSTQVMVKFRLIKSFKHAVYIGIGPVFHYRQTWANMENYIDETVYSTSLDWQHKFSWISGEIEYNFYLNKLTDLSISFNHTQAESIGLAIGFKYWFTRTTKKGCISCPGLH